MGLLVGDTLVVENGGPYVEYSRTYSHVKYSPEKVGIAFNCPKDVPLSEGLFLAKQLVNAQLGLTIEDPKRADKLCRLVLNEPIIAFMQQPTRPTKRATPARSYAADYDYEDEDPID